ncbi:SNF2 family Nterminal domain containing protein [Acanthamoeba castellanii str. Neff]|uniref:SNF2 family Nterminal domain containing protein n=1 Tax=Acanthamoeba castellanii (strain ATCC 30010 / Neff) TaxID=1257118 RepID=L8GKY9_ACACF|nr:SNF2 family Nterminal domain containing protein [Acanthamoeba castellanii str. Neff]ELR13499.1 SNF2 family Nterminal domain containing protein [Acanthamoeba castellanii str. Neff]
MVEPAAVPASAPLPVVPAAAAIAPVPSPTPSAAPLIPLLPGLQPLQPQTGEVAYRNMRVVDLKPLLRQRGLPLSGNKAELVQRLVADDAKKARASSTPAPAPQPSPAIPQPPRPLQAMPAARPPQPTVIGRSSAIDLSQEDEVVSRVAKAEPAFPSPASSSSSSSSYTVTQSSSSSSTVIDLTSIGDDDEDDLDSAVEVVMTTPSGGKASGLERKASVMSAAAAQTHMGTPTTTASSSSAAMASDVTDLSNADRVKRRRLIGDDGEQEEDEAGEMSEQGLYQQMQDALASGLSIEAVVAALRRRAELRRSASSRTSSSFLGAMFTNNETAAPAATPTGRRGRRRIIDSDDDDDDHTDIFGYRSLYVNSPMNAEIEEELPEPPNLEVTLLPHQRQALWWLNKQEKNPIIKGGILADAMGVGKTIEMLSLILHTIDEQNAAKEQAQNRKRVQGGTLVLCPLSTLSQWHQEISDKSQEGALRVAEFYGANRQSFTAASLADYDIVLTTYGTMARGWSSEDDARAFVRRRLGPLHQMTWFRVVLDEGHIIRNESTQAAKAAYALKSKYRWIMSGTPIQNSLDDMYSLLRFLHVPECMDKAWWKQNVDPAGDFTALKKILETLLLRRPKDYEIKGKPIVDLPPLSIVESKLNLDHHHQWVYDYLFKESANLFAQYYSEGTVCDQPMLVALSTLEKEKNAEADRRRRRGRRSRTRHKFSYYEMGRKLRATYAAAPKPGESEGQEGDKALLGELLGVAELCRLCYDEVGPEDKIETSCGHAFCRTCFEDWQAEHEGLQQCPECRLPMRVKAEEATGSPAIKSEGRGRDGVKKEAKEKKKREKRSGRKGKMKKEDYDDDEEEDDEDECSDDEDAKQDRSALFKSLDLSSDDDDELEVMVVTPASMMSKAAAGGRTPTMSAAAAAKAKNENENDDFLFEDLGITATRALPTVKAEGPPVPPTVKAEAPRAGDEATGRRREGEEPQEGEGEAEEREGEEEAAQADGEWDLEEEERRDEEEIQMLLESALVDELETIRDSGTGVKSLVYSQFTRYLDMVGHILRWKGFTFVRLDGRMSKAKRQRSMERFKDDPEVTIFLISLKAGGFGLNLTSASRIYLLDPWWNPATEQQAIDRAHRLGQKLPVVVTRFIIINSIEERILELQKKKNELARGAFEGGSPNRLGIRELSMLFSNRAPDPSAGDQPPPGPQQELPRGPLGAAFI